MSEETMEIAGPAAEPAVAPDAQFPPEPPATPESGPELPPERRRDLRTTTLDDYLSLLGTLIAALCLTWLCYTRLLPFSGTLGFIVCWFGVFLALYAGITALRHPRTQLANRLMGVLMHSAALVVGGVLVYVVVSTIWGGREALSYLNFFTEDLRSTGSLDPLSGGGMVHALVGTLVEIAISIVIVLPLGLLTAVYLNEVGGRAAQVIRTVVEAMTALPDILAGLFIYVLLLLVLGFQFCGFAAAVALSVTMLPITARAAEVVLRVVPNGLREASLALGASQWQTVWRVVLPTARAGLSTALILGVARGIGETAPVLLTAGYGTYVNANPFSGPMTSLPLFAYTLSKSPADTDVSRGFAGAAVLLVLVVLLFVVARVLAGRGTGRNR